MVKEKQPPPKMVGDRVRYATITRLRVIGYEIEFSFGTDWLLSTYEFPTYRLTRWGAERKARRFIRNYDRQFEQKDTWRVE